MKTKYNLSKYFLMAFFLAMAFTFFLSAGEAKADTDCDGGFCIYTGVGCGAHYIWVANVLTNLDRTFNCSASFHSRNGTVTYRNLVPGFYTQRLTCNSPAHNVTLSVHEGCFVEPGPVRARVWGAPSSVNINNLGSTNVRLGVGYFNNLDSNMGFNYKIGNNPLVNESDGFANGRKIFNKTLNSGCPSAGECRFSSTYPDCGGDRLCYNNDSSRYCWDFINGNYVKIGTCNVKCGKTYQILAAVTRAYGFRTASEIKNVLVTCAPPPPPPSPPTLSVTLNANPSSGNAPLTSNLITTVGGTARGPIVYSDRSCGGGSMSNVSGGSFRCQYNSAGNYMARIKVKRQGLTRNASRIITVNPAVTNNPPSIEALPDGGTATVNNNAGINCGGTSDPEGDPLTYQWTQIGGPAVTINNSNQCNASFTVGSTVGVNYVFNLSVSDGINPPVSDQADITSVAVPCLCNTGCEANTCTGTNCNDSCGNPVCPGTKDCGSSKNWKEVVP